MKSNMLRKYIKKQVGLFLENDSSEIVAKYDEIKKQQNGQIDFLTKNLQKSSLKKKINDDKLKKLNSTFSQVQDTELAMIQGGKSEDNKIKKMKQSYYSNEKKDIDNEIKDTNSQIEKMKNNINDIEKLEKQSSSMNSTAPTPTTPTPPSTPKI